MIAILGDERTVTAFRLAGIKHFEILQNDESHPGIILKKLLEIRDLKVILLTQRASQMLDSEINKIKNSKNVFPIIVEIPSIEGKLEKEDIIQKYIKRAVGIDLKEMGT